MHLLQGSPQLSDVGEVDHSVLRHRGRVGAAEERTLPQSLSQLLRSPCSGGVEEWRRERKRGREDERERGEGGREGGREGERERERGREGGKGRKVGKRGRHEGGKGRDGGMEGGRERGREGGRVRIEEGEGLRQNNSSDISRVQCISIHTQGSV